MVPPPSAPQRQRERCT
nr:TPA_asm: m87.4 sORF 4 [Murid betaherpesvirus 1]DBA08027.1 TPA_asm: m87.4 sORF 4 [Murid betaherpesvirus 1]